MSQPEQNAPLAFDPAVVVCNGRDVRLDMDFFRLLCKCFRDKVGSAEENVAETKSIICVSDLWKHFFLDLYVRDLPPFAVSAGSAEENVAATKSIIYVSDPWKQFFLDLYVCDQETGCSARALGPKLQARKPQSRALGARS